MDRAKEESREVHIRVQQRNGKKSITSIIGLNPAINFNRLLKHWKESWGCNGNIIEQKEGGKVLQLQGNLGEKISEFLTSEKLAKQADIRLFTI